MIRHDARSGRSPSAPALQPGAALAGGILGLALLVLAGIAIRDLIVRAGWIHGHEWLRGATHWGTHSGWKAWMWPVAVAAILAGLAMVWSAVKPRPRPYLGIGDDEVLWTRPRDIARRCSAAVKDLPGVDGATTLYGGRKLTVTVAADPAVDEAAVVRAVQPVLTTLRLSPKIKVKMVRSRTKEPR